MPDQKRPYRMKRRAELEQRTRRRIAESAVELHGTLGPSRTSISAVAERAGVRRSTVYRHFPDELALFTACSGLWMEANPLPELAPWADIEDPDARLRSALDDLYRYYRRTEPMLSNLFRDEATVPAVAKLFGTVHAYLAATRDTLMSGRRTRGRSRRRQHAAIGHALAFSTWRSLVREQGLTDSQAAELMCRLVPAA